MTDRVRTGSLKKPVDLQRKIQRPKSLPDRWRSAIIRYQHWSHEGFDTMLTTANLIAQKMAGMLALKQLGAITSNIRTAAIPTQESSAMAKVLTSTTFKRNILKQCQCRS